MLTPPSLNTSQTSLRLLNKADYSGLLQAARDQDVWRWFPVDISRPSDLESWMNTMLQDFSAGHRIPLTIVDRKSEQIIGSSSYMHIAERELCLEIGTTWIAKEYHGSGINFHVKYCMLEHAFGVWHFERVEFRTDALNVRSRRAIEKIGASYEGLFRNHRFNKEGGRRDSVIYSILKSEWTEIKSRIFKHIS